MYDIDQICKKVNGVNSKKISLKISGINSLKSAKKNEISFFSDLKYLDYLKESKASVFLVSDKLRNKVENTNPSSVLNGNIDQFIEEGIKNR